MKLNLDTLGPGANDLDVDEAFALDPEGERSGRVRAQGVLRAANTTSRVYVSGDLDVTGSAVCDRCLAEFPLGYEASVEIQIVRSTDPAPEDVGEEISTLHQMGGEIDLDGALREAVVLALPLKRLCREDCLGLCAHCGADRNQNPCDCEQEVTDPRWDGLPT